MPLVETIQQYAGLWQALRGRNIVVTATRSAEGAFHRAEDLPGQAQSLSKNGVTGAVLKALCKQLKIKKPAHACVIDLVQAAALVQRQRLKPLDALLRARVRYQGTDGVRGRVAEAKEDESPLKALVERAEFTPAVCELLCTAFLLQQKAQPGAALVLAEDGRDPRRAMARAAVQGCSRCGVRVLDLGVAPTPLVPVASARLNAKFGAVITASHNPADQNGIKFFADGRKQLPEPDDLAVSAWAFILALEGLPAAQEVPTVDSLDAAALLSAFFQSALPAADIRRLARATLIVDVAHGAFAPYARRLLAELGMKAEILNEDAAGDNINHDSGVAHLEGKERIVGADIDSQIAIVGRVRELAQKANGPVFGLALDGDGDRGFLLVYDAGADEVRIVDGDRAAYLLARAGGKARGRVFAGTVESDLAIFRAVSDLGIKIVMTPVGDKWLSARPALADKLLVGEESSGHMVWPVKVGKQTVLTGNGLLTGLRTAAAIAQLKLEPPVAAEPFEPGVVKTFYTYFVDRPRFHRGGPVWLKDLEIAAKGLKNLKAAGLLPSSSCLRPVLFKDDPDMLYLNVQDTGRQIGAIFARNSGTENKTATYARGRIEFQAGLVAMAGAINRNHMRMLKDERLPEARACGAIARLLVQQKRVAIADARRVAGDCGVTGDARFHALLFALTKEGAAKRTDDSLEIVT